MFEWLVKAKGQGQEKMLCIVKRVYRCDERHSGNVSGDGRKGLGCRNIKTEATQRYNSCVLEFCEWPLQRLVNGVEKVIWCDIYIYTRTC